MVFEPVPQGLQQASKLQQGLYLALPVRSVKIALWGLISM
jgi:hypothetical protein